jgi:hypothetical protein
MAIASDPMAGKGLTQILLPIASPHKGSISPSIYYSNAKKCFEESKVAL